MGKPEDFANEAMRPNGEHTPTKPRSMYEQKNTAIKVFAVLAGCAAVFIFFAVYNYTTDIEIARKWATLEMIYVAAGIITFCSFSAAVIFAGQQDPPTRP